jgi:hypothetical protein
LFVFQARNEPPGHPSLQIQIDTQPNSSKGKRGLIKHLNCSGNPLPPQPIQQCCRHPQVKSKRSLPEAQRSDRPPLPNVFTSMSPILPSPLPSPTSMWRCPTMSYPSLSLSSW